MTDHKKKMDEPDANLDPLTGEPGAHPVGTGLGAGAAGSIGAVIGGVVGGPVGAVVGATIGAVSGGLLGKSAAEAVDPTVEDAYWRDNHSSRPYIDSKASYDAYAPAYKTGVDAFSRHAETEKTFEEIEPELKSEYEKTHGATDLGWDKARHAAQDAYLKLYEERLVAGKHKEKTGEVTVGKRIETDTETVSVPVEKERVVVERSAPKGQTIVTPDEAVFQDGEVARVEVYEETPDIHKEAFVREEVRVRKEIDREVVNAEEQIRREELDVNTEGRPVVDADI
jgi:uncharacterized protein (TIGR02271 family)